MVNRLSYLKATGQDVQEARLHRQLDLFSKAYPQYALIDIQSYISTPFLEYALPAVEDMNQALDKVGEIQQQLSEFGVELFDYQVLDLKNVRGRLRLVPTNRHSARIDPDNTLFSKLNMFLRDNENYAVIDIKSAEGPPYVSYTFTQDELERCGGDPSGRIALVNEALAQQGLEAYELSTYSMMEVKRLQCKVRHALPKEVDVEDAPEESAEDGWRRLALQFDEHRMTALGHLKAMVADAEKHKAAATTFLAGPPLSGEAVLAQRLKELLAQQPVLVNTFSEERKITELVFFGNDQAFAKMKLMRDQLDRAMSYASGMQQGVLVNSPEYIRGEAIVQASLQDLAAGLLGREIEFAAKLPYPNLNPIRTQRCPYCIGRLGRVCTTCEDCCGSGVIPVKQGD